MVTKILLYFLSLFGWKPEPAPAAPTPVRPAPCPPPSQRPRIYTEAQQVRDAVDTLHKFERAHVLGVTRPSADVAAKAWDLLESLLLPLAGFLRACAHLGLTWPVCPRGSDPDLWLTAVLEQIGHEIERIVVTAIFKGCVMRAWRAVENVMARAVEHSLRGGTPVVVYAGGPTARREVHVRDSVRTEEHPQGRVIVARAYEHGLGGRIEILDREGAELSPETLRRSGWTLCDGWIAIAGQVGGRRPPAEDGDAPRDDNTPPGGLRR
ncbi:hypothetical protein [Bradyrhizobium sp. CCBAU 21360]|uniref:hypothetical protein n=1 Tax=Bradyrhizobium sp. CCBAU 21360 TaxID=1325081 RepID=UPI002305C34C|nr:hypothetical protein [Bradyrhizobium sp. CCBAU 21360]MDA9452328.1 hypothetical protein [Bradyrhizobium sp. CCBAU 21360]